MAGSLAENAQRSFWDEWAKVTCPTLAVLGQSGIISPQEADTMLRHRPATVAVSIPGTGHDVRLEQPGVLHHLLAEYLDEVVGHRAQGLT